MLVSFHDFTIFIQMMGGGGCDGENIYKESRQVYNLCQSMIIDHVTNLDDYVASQFSQTYQFRHYDKVMAKFF